METKIVVTNLIKALENQELTYSETLCKEAFIENFDYQTGAKKMASKVLQSFNNRFVSYDHIDKDAFAKDLSLFQKKVDEKMLVAWGYKSGCLLIIGIMHGDNLDDSDLKSLFSRFDDGVTNIMRSHTGHVSGGNKGGVYGTMLMVFSDSGKAKHFNDSIRNYYSSHFLKSTYISAMSIDCSSHIFIQGKGALGSNWSGGLDISHLKNQLFVF